MNEVSLPSYCRKSWIILNPLPSYKEIKYQETMYFVQKGIWVFLFKPYERKFSYTVFRGGI